jgi:hypothetical protein
MAWIRRINQLPEKEKEGIYRVLIPPELFPRFKIHPLTFVGPSGHRSVRMYCPKDDAVALVEVKASPEDLDPIYSIQISDLTDHTMCEWEFLIVNDPASPRFGIDMDAQGRDTLFGRASRNLEEERRAMEAGLLPGQVRAGLRLTRTVVACLEHFAKAFNIQSIFLEALFYHNAIVYEKLGFSYFEGFRMMKRIDELFRPGAELWRRLDGSSPFRQPGYDRSVRGRSWAIHDGILEGIDDGVINGEWVSPRMYRMVGRPAEVCTFPGSTY